MLSAAGASQTTAAHRTVAVVGIAAALGYLAALAWAMGNLSYDVWGAMVVGPVLVAVSVPLLERIGRADPDRRVMRLLFVAFAAKMAGALVRYAVTFEVYGGRADAGGYHGSGRRLAAAFWNGTWDRVLQQEVPELAGTEFIRLVTGAVYVVTGPTKLGGFLVFAWLGFWGLVCLFRAFRVAFPGGDHWRYGILLFFLPSLLYWPSSLGKESWMLFAIGVAAYGAALVLSHRPHGYVVLVVGFAATAAVRPHVTLLLFVALFVAVLLRRRSWRETRLGLLGRIAGLAVLVGIGTVVFAQTADFFNVDNLDQSSVEQVLDRASEQSAGGTSEFDAPRLTSPAEYPYAFLTVVFRPLPWEANNTPALVAATEGFILLVLTVCSWRRLVRLPGFFLRVPYVAFAATYVGLFVLAFSSIANFGLLTRQRTQVLPLFLVLLAIPAARRSQQLAPERAVAKTAAGVEHQPRPLGNRVER